MCSTSLMKAKYYRVFFFFMKIRILKELLLVSGNSWVSYFVEVLDRTKVSRSGQFLLNATLDKC